MDVSVIIVNYNTLQLTKASIASIRQLTKEVTYEIIVVDNASSQDATELESHADEFIQSTENLGFAKGNNLGIQHASGEFILLLNSDTVLKNDAISIVYNYLVSNRSMAVASARLEYPDGRLQHVCQRFPELKYTLIELFRIQKFWSPDKRAEVLKGAFFDHRTSTTTDWIWGTFFMFRARLLKELPGGKLPDDFFMYAEDIQWCKEFKNLGYEIGYEPAAQVVHYMGASSGKKEMWMTENNIAFQKKYYSAISIHLNRVASWLLRLSLVR